MNMRKLLIFYRNWFEIACTVIVFWKKIKVGGVGWGFAAYTSNMVDWITDKVYTVIRLFTTTVSSLLWQSTWHVQQEKKAIYVSCMQYTIGYTYM